MQVHGAPNRNVRPSRDLEKIPTVKACVRNTYYYTGMQGIPTFSTCTRYYVTSQQIRKMTRTDGPLEKTSREFHRRRNALVLFVLFVRKILLPTNIHSVTARRRHKMLCVRLVHACKCVYVGRTMRGNPCTATAWRSTCPSPARKLPFRRIQTVHQNHVQPIYGKIIICPQGRPAAIRRGS